MHPLVIMKPIGKCVPSAFDTFFTRNVPHILENIFFSLDYKSFKTCMRVNTAWRTLFSTARYQRKLEEKLREKMENEKKLFCASKDGKSEEVRRLINDYMVEVNFAVGQNQFTPRLRLRWGATKKLSKCSFTQGQILIEEARDLLH